MSKVRRMPAPWEVVPLQSGFRINDADGKGMAYVYYYNDHARAGAGPQALNPEEARRVARAIARLPELLADANGAKTAALDAERVTEDVTSV